MHSCAPAPLPKHRPLLRLHCRGNLNETHTPRLIRNISALTRARPGQQSVRDLLLQ